MNMAKTYFDLSFKMLEKMINQCPDHLWNDKKEDLYSGNNYHMLLLELIFG